MLKVRFLHLINYVSVKWRMVDRDVIETLVGVLMGKVDRQWGETYLFGW